MVNQPVVSLPTRTLAIIIGISTYKHNGSFAGLDAAISDARWFARALRSNGLPSTHVKLLLNEDATRPKILEAIRVWAVANSSGPIKLLLYFAGHGVTVTESGLPTSVLVTYDTDPRDRLGTGLTLEDLVKALRRLELLEAYLFIDACYQALRTVEIVLPDRDHFASFVDIKRCFFCMLSAESMPAYEDTIRSKGLFTELLLNHLNQMSGQTSPAIVELARRVEEGLTNLGQQTPATILYGSSQAWPLAGLDNVGEIGQLENNTSLVERLASSRLILDHIRKKHPRAVWVRGESGLGKSELAKQIVKEHADIFYISLPLDNNINNTEAIDSYVAGSIADQSIQTFPGGRPFDLASATIEHIGRTTPRVIVIVDHAERVDISLIVHLEQLLRVNKLQLVIFARLQPHSPPCFEPFDCPRVVLDEVVQFLQVAQSDLDPSVALAGSEGNALRLRQLLSQKHQALSGQISLNTSLAHMLAASTGFIDPGLYSEVTGTSGEQIAPYRAAGYIVKQDEVWVPHDSLLEAVSCDQLGYDEGIELQKKACVYWAKQCLHTPKSTYAARCLAVLVRKTLHCDALIDSATAVAVEELFRSRDWQALQSLPEAFLSLDPLPFRSAIKLCEVLIEQGHREIVLPLLVRLHSHADSDDLCSVNLLRARYDWWNGEFSECISHATTALSLATTEHERCLSNLEIGMAHFFCGQWDEARASLQIASRIQERNPRTTAWAKAILGTIDGLRGVNVPLGCELLESAIYIMKSIDDQFGLAAAMANLAEIRWKTGQLDLAWGLLDVALTISRNAGNRVIELECRRDQLHVALRRDGPHAARTSALLSELTETDWAAYGKTELMQLYDTLSTAYIYRNDVSNAARYADKADFLTSGNPEYSIYTSANKALGFVLNGDRKNALHYAHRAAEIARSGANWLALRQLHGDALVVARLYPSPLSEEVAEVFAQSEQPANPRAD